MNDQTLGNDQGFMEPDELPDTPPVLRVNGVVVAPFAIEWRTDETENVAPGENFDRVGRVPTTHDIRVTISNTASPSTLTIGLYPQGLDAIDPMSPPPLTYDGKTGDGSMVEDGATQSISLILSMSPDATANVIVVSATYLVLVDGEPGRSTISWVAEVARAG
ncbi:hypothetical protein GCM10009860_22350 [Microbacterium mitrae]|uniref:Uncharacterized protein n=1 Tax=Microbacterium mitrae TaxID=664640 RepID=A0A5C8HP46_9MICO|nr:hypothetical protein [Microbacterium mitrae]TXK04081.1 hypothetical protein FVP60_09945 [Microbacterium mitrae]